MLELVLIYINMTERKTKIVCTIGPSSWDPEVMRKMIEAGMNCARVNGAFADEAELDKVTKLVRDVSDEVSLMMDVKGPEVRMNKFAEAKPIQPGDMIEIGNDASSEIYPGNYKDLYQKLEIGQRIVIGDGDVELVIREIKGDKMYVEVVFGELLKPGKAMNLPGAAIATSALTEKDMVNLRHSLKLGWDMVSASFIQNKQSALEVKKHLEGSKMQLIAKIEDQEGVDNIDEILEVVDGIMVARGGLGVELGLENVPMVQRHLIERANAVGKPVITATQMLESMITNPRPTRAEVNDVATAIMIGSDSVMLSGESSAGKYPVEAVEWLARTADSVESKLRQRKFDNNEEVLKYNIDHNDDLGRGAVAMADAVANVCRDLDVKAVIVMTKRGFTARVLSRYKIKQPIYAYVAEKSTEKRLVLTGGVHAKMFDGFVHNRDIMIEKIIAQAKNDGLINSGDLVAIVIGAQLFAGIESSMLDIQRVG
jgi:pyruvate kinase